MSLICLDNLRRELKIKPGRGKGRAIANANETAKKLLREKRDFIWDATNITRSMREGLINKLYSYSCRVHIVYIEAPEKTVFERNLKRDSGVPGNRLEKLVSKLEPPDLSECHGLKILTT